VAAAFPSACGKTNFAMMIPPKRFDGLEGLDGRRRHRVDAPADGRLYAINPESGYFGVAPGTSMKTNPNAMKMIARHDLHQRRADRRRRRVVGRHGRRRRRGADRLAGQAVDAGLEGEGRAPELALHRAGATTRPVARGGERPEGRADLGDHLRRPRRERRMPLVYQAFNWAHGVYLGATMARRPPPPRPAVGVVRRDPMAMLPFCGYNMGDYFRTG
jgi:phosphoenolpyruvate carboxykinase (GTP)